MRRAPYIFLLVLFIILIFVIGVRYGQKVEKTNKTIDYVISLTPRVSPTPPAVQTLGFKTYAHKACGVSFLYPSTLKIAEESTTSASLESGTREEVAITCLAKPLPTVKEEGAVATELTFQGKKISATKKANGGATVLSFSLLHPVTSRTVVVTIVESLYPLFEKSATFTQPILPSPTRSASPSAR